MGEQTVNRKDKIMRIPTVSCYAPGTSGDLANCIRVDIEPLVLWFSYRTLIAFKVGGLPIVVHENDWGVTTGKHLNAIDREDKGNRVSDQQFQALWLEQTANLDPLIAAVALARS